MVCISILLTQALAESIFTYQLGYSGTWNSKRTWALQALDAPYLVDSPPTVLPSKDNHESFPPHMPQTENILNYETSGKVSLPACGIPTDLSFFLKSCSQTKYVFLNNNFSLWNKKRCL